MSADATKMMPSNRRVVLIPVDALVLNVHHTVHDRSVGVYILESLDIEMVFGYPTSFSLLDTLVLCGARAFLLLTCQRFALGAFRQQLKTADTPDDDIELDALPAPSSAPARSTAQTSHSRNLSIANIAFSLCFSESCMLFHLLMAQAVDLYHPGSRMLHWLISLFILLSLLLAVIPISLSLVTTSSLFFQCLPGPSRILPLVVYFILLSYVPLPDALSESVSQTWMGTTFARLVLLGVVLLGGLSGYGSVTTAWGYFPFICGPRQKRVSEAQLLASQESHARIVEELRRKREAVAAQERAQEGKQQSWMARTFRGDELSALKTELTALSALERNMLADLQQLQERRVAETFDRTFTGALYVLLRRATGIYCIFRGFTSIMNLVLPSPTSSGPGAGYPDVLTSLLTSVIGSLPFSQATVSALEEQVPWTIRQLNLIVVGAIILSSLRRVLVALRIVSGRGRGASTGGVLVLAQVMGIYFLSTLVQLRTSFPPSLDTEGQDTNLFSTLPEYQLFGPVFDLSFLIAATVAGSSEYIRAKAGEDID
ncbi:unnamed protein product [Peniophora sp. CBMAI 1063]|nr:unnamed protein product [Peniophora sp. CBMAI 1063]